MPHTGVFRAGPKVEARHGVAFDGFAPARLARPAVNRSKDPFTSVTIGAIAGAAAGDKPLGNASELAYFSRAVMRLVISLCLLLILAFVPCAAAGKREKVRPPMRSAAAVAAQCRAQQPQGLASCSASRVLL